MAQAHDVTGVDCAGTFSTEQQRQQQLSQDTQNTHAAAAAAPAEQTNASAPCCVAAAEPTPSAVVPRRQKRKGPPAQPRLAASPSPTPSAEDMASLPLLVCSIGNPGAAYANTLHSAGHTVVQAMARLLQTSAFSKDRGLGNGLVARSHDPEVPWTLWQSTSYMNESGKGVGAAHRAWSRGLVGPAGRVVVVHDEMEKPLGSVSVRDQAGLSAKGHNGIKSCMASLGGVKFVRVGVGIGRPVSRSSEDVSKFVLRKMTPVERARIEEAAGEVLSRLMALKG